MGALDAYTPQNIGVARTEFRDASNWSVMGSRTNNFGKIMSNDVIDIRSVLVIVIRQRGLVVGWSPGG